MRLAQSVALLELGLSVALLELGLGVVAGNAFGLDPDPALVLARRRGRAARGRGSAPSRRGRRRSPYRRRARMSPHASASPPAAIEVDAVKRE